MTGKARHLSVAALLGGLVVGMVGLSFAAVPLYDMFCRVTGYGGTTQRADAPAGRVLDRSITIRFDSTVAGDLPWQVKPEDRTLTVRIGETATMTYVARNLSDGATVGTSTFNVSPPSAGIYFNKIECFCFTEQPLAPGASAKLPVVFFVDPAIVDDQDTAGLGEITLSYTFFPTAGAAQEKDKPVAAASDRADRRPL